MTNSLKDWFVLSIAFILFAYIIGVSRADGDYGIVDSRYCDEKNIIIQLAYVLDCTHGFNKTVHILAANVEELSKTITKTMGYGVFEQAVVCFSDYIESTKPYPRGNPTTTHKEDCYKRKSSMSTDPTSVAKNLRRAGFSLYGGSNNVESSTTALTFAAADTKVGWVNGIYDTANRKVRKIIVLGTDERNTIGLEKPGKKRKPAKGDGKDTCHDNLPPTPEIVEAVLTKNNISVVGIFHNRAHSNAFDYYQDYFSKFKIQYSQIKVSDDSMFTGSEMLKAILEDTNRSLDAECQVRIVTRSNIIHWVYSLASIRL